METSSTTHVLEINLISAQGLKPPVTALRRLKTYAVAWINRSVKLRTRIDRIGGENPSWNDKFFFNVSSDFLSDPLSAVTIKIYAVGIFQNHFLGSVRFLLSLFLPNGNGFSLSSFSSSSPIAGIGTPAFSAVQIRRPSGRFHGVLNIAAMVIIGSDLVSSTGLSAVGYRDLIGENRRSRRRRNRPPELSHGSTPSSSTSSTAALLPEKKEEVRMLCGLGVSRKIHP